MLLYRNSTNFAKVNTTETNQNSLIVNVSSCEKTSNFPEQTRKETN